MIKVGGPYEADSSKFGYTEPERVFFLTILVPRAWKSPRDEAPRFFSYDWLLQPTKSESKDKQRAFRPYSYVWGT